MMTPLLRIVVIFLFPLIALSLTTSTTKSGPVARTGPLFGARDKTSPFNGRLQKAAVCGATGRLGLLVTNELVSRGVDVVAIVRNSNKAESLGLGDNPKVTVMQCNLSFQSEISTAIEGCDTVFWCATGFSDSETRLLDKLKTLLGIAIAPKKSIDSVSIPAIASSMLEASDSEISGLPQIVMCSSAGVTRTSWSEEKKTKLAGCADIPIVRLNPFGILDIKADSENSLRESGVRYCIVRPCGLNDSWPSNCRPVFSQGDVAVGRINRKDLSKILVDTAYASEACGKTFEVFSLTGYAPSTNIIPLLQKLRGDSEDLSEEVVENTYNLMQQLLPGEQQDAASLAMGQTYEEYDEGVQGRLGARGSEDVGKAGIKPTNI